MYHLFRALVLGLLLAACGQAASSPSDGWHGAARTSTPMAAADRAAFDALATAVLDTQGDGATALYLAEHVDRFPRSLVAGTDVSDWSMSAAGAAGGMYSTVEDLGAWAATGYGSTLLSIRLAELRLTPHGTAAYGYGIMRAGDWTGHGGQTHGWFLMTGFNVVTGATFVAIVNSGGGERAVEALAGFAFPNSPFAP